MSSSSSIAPSGKMLHVAAEVVDAGPTELPANTFEMRPNPRNSFKNARVKEIVNDVLHEVLQGKVYTPNKVPDWVCSISDDVSTRCKELSMCRYRHVVQVMLAQQNGAGCKYLARCRWDAECDSQVSAFFSNETLVCVVTVFGVYLY